MSSPLSGDTLSSSLGGDANVFGAFGSLLGYVGVEAVATASFEDLLWPQRSLSNFTASSLPWLALLKPMGGPMHRAALKVFDTVYNYGLLKKGMSRDTCSGIHEKHTELLGNCILAQALSLLPMPNLDEPKQFSNMASIEGGIKRLHNKMVRVRAKLRVSHLHIAKATEKDKKTLYMPFVRERHGTPGLRVLLAICGSELSAIGVAAGAGAYFSSLWAFIWLVPLVLRLISAIFAVEREPLTSATDPPCDIEVHCPQSEGNFLLLSGAPMLVLQFARHYGHPKRDRLKEVVQLTIVVMFACLFPIELVCSIIWMPVPLQNVWLCYQLYVVLAMHVARYSKLGSASSTPAALASALAKEGCTGRDNNKSEHAILFGHSRDGPETLKISVVSTYHDRYEMGREALGGLLRRNSSEPQTTLCESEPKM